MAVRFRRSIKIAPGFRVNFGKKGVSVSAGKRGASTTISRRGVYGNVGIPGTGLSYRTKLSSSNKKRTQCKTRGVPSPAIPTSNAIQADVKLILSDDGQVTIEDVQGNPLPPKYVKIARDQNAVVFDKWLQDKCDELNADVETILNIHLESPSPDEEIIFKPEPFASPKPLLELAEPPTPKKAGLLGSIFSSRKMKIEEQNRADSEAYEKDIQNKQRTHLETVNEWEAEKKQFEESQEESRSMIEKGRFEEVEGMNQFLEEIFNQILWPRETVINFELQDEGKKLMLDVDLPEIEDLPENVVSVAKNSLKLQVKERSETQKRKDYMTHIHGIGFRLIGESFTALPNLEEVILSAYSQRLNPATGKTGDEYLFSVMVKRPDWKLINFENLSQIDLSECLGSFEIRRKMTKTGVFRPIEPF